MFLYCRVTIQYKSAYASKGYDKKKTNEMSLTIFLCEKLIKKVNEAMGLHMKNHVKIVSAIFTKIAREMNLNFM